MGADFPRRAFPAESSCSPISNPNVGSQRPPITKRERKARIDRLIAKVEQINLRGGAIVSLPDWWRTELVILGVRIPTPLTGALLHEALLDAQADALDTLPWPPKKLAASWRG